MSFLMDGNPDSHHYHNHHIPTPPAATYTTEQVSLPKVGQTRCYWALLSSDLQFIYLDPVLNYHLGEQSELLVGKSLLSFVHPDEQASAKRDLGNVLDSKTLYGSVTRVRYARLSNVRRQLGYQGPGPDWVDAEKICLDKDYLAVDLVINWAADGLVLCFIHAIVDLSSQDNDEVNKTDWTNWCGTPWMPPEQLGTMYRRFLMCVPQTGSMSRVFQILQNERERLLLISWPPDSAHSLSSKDFAKLVENVQISAGVPGGSDAKTSCTRRYKALQDMPAVFGCQVESIFIPHGTIIFACHKVSPIHTRTAAVMNQVDYPPYPPFYDQGSPYNAIQPLPPHEAAYSNGFSNASYTPQRWPSDNTASVASNVRDLRSDYPTASSPLTWSSTSPSPSSTTASYISGPHLSSNHHPALERPLSSHNYNTAYTTLPAGGSSNNNSSASAVPGVSSSSADVIPPSRRRVTPNSTRGRDSGTGCGHGPGTTGSGRGNGAPVSKPTGVLKCSSCKTTQSPEWRKGPSGKKELCNACGLRYARSRAKKEGTLTTPARRRKDKSDLVKRESATPPSYAPYPPPAQKGSPRRGLDHGSSPQSSGEVYATHIRHPRQNHALDGRLSPSPPLTASGSTSAILSQYAAGHGQRHEIRHRVPPPFSTTSNTLYSPSSPLQQPPHQHYPSHSISSPSATNVYHQHHQHLHTHTHTHHPHQTVSHPQLPPLDQIKSPHAPVTSSAYEHERDMREHPSPHQGQQQRMQPLPLSAGESGEGYRR